MTKGSIEVSIRDVPEVKAELERYRKAFDKACERLKDFDLVFPSSLRSGMTKEQWKEYLLKDE